MPQISILLQWLVPWEPSPLFFGAITATAIFFLRGLKSNPRTIWQQLCFWLGLISIYIVSHTLFDYYSEHEFFMHRTQHAVLHHAAPFLIALSRPGSVLLEGMPIKWKSYLEKFFHTQTFKFIAGMLSQPIMAVALFIGLILFWLIPQIHYIAMLDFRLYRVMNWSMLLSGLLFWNIALNNYGLKPTYLSPGYRIAMLLIVIPAQIIIGMMIFLAPHELYPLYSICGRAFAVSPLADQQLGGLILWIPAAMMSVLGILIIINKEWMGLGSSRPKPSLL